MRKDEAAALIASRIAELRRLPYSVLRDCYLDRDEWAVVRGRLGATYEVQTNAFWDDQRAEGGNLRVIVSIDYGRRWLRFVIVPLTDSFIVAPDGSFVGE